MKQIFILIGVLLFIFACTTQRGVIQVKNNTVEVSAEDSLEYDLETFDSKFESWYLFQKSPAKYRSQFYYENWNKQYVLAWNAKLITSRNSFFEPIIGYSPGTDYGFELNHELFYYFQYVEQVLKIEIMPGGPKVVLF